MAQNPSGLDMFREIVGQINNLRKLVTVNGKQYRYDPKSKGYKADGKTFTPSQLKAKLKGQSYTAPKIDNKSKIKIKPKLKRTGKLYPGGISRPDKGRYGRNLPSKDKYGVPSQKKRLLKPKTTPKTSVKTKVSQAANNVKNVGKNLKIKNLVKNVNVKQGAVDIAAGLVTELGINRQGIDRIARQLAGKSKMTMQEFRAERDKKLKEKEKSILTGNKGAKRTNFRKTGAERNKIVKENAKKATLGKIITTKDYEHGRRQTSKGKTKYWNKNTNSWQTNKPGPLIKKAPNPSTPPTSTKLTRAEKLKKGMGTWRKDSEEQKKLNKGETNTQVKIKKTPPKDNKNNNNNKDAGAGASSRGSWTDNQLSKTKKKTLTPAQKEAKEKKEWLKKSRNSPAAKAFGNSPEANEKRWKLQKAYRDKYKKKRGW